MSETTDMFEGFPPDDNVRLAQKVGNSLLAEFSYTHLSEADLRGLGLIRGGQSFAGFIIDRLGLNDPLQSEAFTRLTEEIPPPIDTDVVYEAQNKQILSPDEEGDVRRSVFGEKPNLVDKLRTVSGKEMLALKILDSAGIWRSKYDSSLNPDEVKGNLQMFETILQQEPTVINVGRARRFALRMPHKPSEHVLAGVISAIMPPTIGEYVVVTDRDKNSELSTYLFSQPDLLRYFMAKVLSKAQLDKITNLSSEFRDLAHKKYREIEHEVEIINTPLRLHAFNLLVKDAKKKEGITLISIFRDRHDVAALKDEKPPKTDRIGSESGAEIFKVQAEDNTLTFRWDGIDHSFEDVEEGGKKVRKMVSRPTQFQTQVRLNQQGKLEFGEEDKSGNIEWKIEDLNSLPAVKVHWLFETISVLSREERLKLAENVAPETDRIIKTMQQTQSSVEFFTKSRELGISGYPTREVIINTNPKLHYVVDVFPQRLDSGKIGQN